MTWRISLDNKGAGLTLGTNHYLVYFPYKTPGNYWCWMYRVIKPNTSNQVTKLVNPFPFWKRYFVWKYEQFLLWRNDEEYKRCQGCGEGIAGFRIKDPNNATKRLNCCKGCVDFYNTSWSAKKITDKMWKRLKK